MRLVHEPGLVPSVRALLAAAEWGTDGPRYRIADPDAELRTLGPDTHVLTATRDGTPVGCYLLAPRTWVMDGRRLRGYYRGLLAVQPDLRRRGYGRFLVQAVAEHYLRGPGDADFLYGYIEEDNHSSLNLAHEGGYRSAGLFGAYAFSRSGRVTSDPDVRTGPEARDLLTSIRANRSPLLEEDVATGLRDRRHYWLADGDRVVAAASGKAKRWTFTHLPGWSGWLARTVGPITPVLGRLFRPQDFRFVALGHLVEAPGAHRAFERLLGHLLVAAGCPVGIAFLDPRSELTQRWQRRRAYGWLQALGLTSRLHFMLGLRCNERTAGVEDRLAAGPLPLSLRDDA
jgi:GNAT superfamily N-acetyltransferase